MLEDDCLRSMDKIEGTEYLGYMERGRGERTDSKRRKTSSPLEVEEEAKAFFPPPPLSG